MKDDQDADGGETLRRIAETLARFGVGADTPRASSGTAKRESAEDEPSESVAAAARESERAAREWLAAGFDDPEEVEDWLRARCFSPASAAALERAGITPEQAALRTRAGSADYEETIAYKLTRGDLSFDEARRIITSDFWNS